MTTESDREAGARQGRRGQRQLVAIWLLFLAPVVAAWLTWNYLSGSAPGTTSNAGTLITPARPLTAFDVPAADGSRVGLDDIRGRWTYVVFAGSDCDTRCRQQLYITRQTHTAMNKDMARVQRLMVFAEEPAASLLAELRAEHPALAVAVAADGIAQQFVVDGWRSDGGAFFLVDPLGNLMMAYTLDIDPKGMRKDLRRLLKISQIG